MIGFSSPMWLAAMLPWAFFVALLASEQRPALTWINANVAPRWRHRFTRLTRRGVILYGLLLFLMGAFLALAAAGPYRLASGVKEVTSHSVFLLIDGSLSMGATDVEPHPGAGETPPHRFAQATEVAKELVAAMPEARFGLITFSGVAVVHAPPTYDHTALNGQLDTLSYHVDLTRSGTHFSSGFDAVIHLAQHEPGSYQIVLMSDGELPQSDAFEEALEVLVELDIPIHALGFGSTEGQARVVYEPEDIINRVEEKRVAQRYHTRREDSTLELLAETTGGSSWTVADGDWTGTLLAQITQREPVMVEASGKVKHDLSRIPLAAFVLAFLIDTLWISRRPQRNRKAPTAAAPRAGLAALLLVAMLLSGCRPRVLQAHVHNELGIGLHKARNRGEADSRFQKSMSFRVRRHVPLFNLGVNAAARDEHAVAHDYYQEVLLLEPRLVEAHYNDGHALFGWGGLELDVEECRFERTRQLWTQALKRFRDAMELGGPAGGYTASARANAEFLELRLEELDQQEEVCVPPPPNESSSSGGGGGNSNEPPPPEPPPSGGAPPPPSSGEEPPPPPPPGKPPPGEPPPSGTGEPPPGEPPPGEPPPGGGGGGGLSDDEKEEIRAALERIRQESSAASGYKQSEHQQITEDTVGKASGKEIWW